MSNEQGAAPERHVPWAALGAAVTGIIGYVAWAAARGIVTIGSRGGVDFFVYYQAAAVLRRGEDIYQAGISPPYVYPPLLAVLALPLLGWPIAEALIIWRVVQHACLVIAGGLLVSLLPRHVRPVAVGVLLLGALTVPLHDEILVGESNSLVLLLEAGAIWLIARRRGATNGSHPALLGAGGLLAVATSIKVLPVLLIAYCWLRGPRTVAVVATVAFVAIQEMLVILTPATIDYWLVQFPALFGQAFPYFDNQSLNAAVARALLPPDPGIPAMQLLAAPDLRPALTWLANGVLIVATVALLARRRRHPPAGPVQLLLETGLVLLTTFLVSGSTWLHHLVGLAVPLVALTGIALHSGGPHRRPAAAAVAAILVLLTVRPADVVDWVAGMLPGVPLAAWLASNMALGVVLAGWAACAWLLTHEPPSLSGWYNEGETTGRKAPVSTLPSRAATTKGSPRTSEV